MSKHYELAKTIADLILAETDDEVKALVVAEYVKIRLAEKMTA